MKINKEKALSIIGGLFKHAFLALASFLSLFPFFWIIIGSTNNTKEITKGVLTIGKEFMNNMAGVQASGNIFQAILNTTVITFVLPLAASYAPIHGKPHADTVFIKHVVGVLCRLRPNYGGDINCDAAYYSCVYYDAKTIRGRYTRLSKGLEIRADMMPS